MLKKLFSFKQRTVIFKIQNLLYSKTFFPKKEGAKETCFGNWIDKVSISPTIYFCHSFKI